MEISYQYYYKVDGCSAKDANDFKCICWHNEGTGALSEHRHSDTDRLNWREAPIENKHVMLRELHDGECFVLADPPHSDWSGLFMVPYFYEMNSDISKRRHRRAVEAGRSKMRPYGAHIDDWYSVDSDTLVILVPDGHSYYENQRKADELNKAKELCQANGYMVIARITTIDESFVDPIDIFECKADAPELSVVLSEHESDAIKMNREAIIKQATDRFLGWKLPKGFNPDGGISFRSESEYNHPHFGRNKYEPIGTNLFSADQAKEMFEYCILKDEENEP